MSNLTNMFGPGECVENSINGIMGVLSASNVTFDHNKFLNPQEISILNSRQAGVDAKTRFMDYYGALIKNPLDTAVVPDSSPPINYLDKALAAYNKWPDIMDACKIWTDYLSGKSAVFPLPALMGKGITNEGGYFKFKGDPFCASNYDWQLLANLSFAGMLGIIKGGHQTSFVTCNLDPNDPCGKVNGVFSTVLGGLNAALNTINAGFAAMEEFAGKCREIIDKIEGYIQTIAMAIANEINQLIARAIEGLRYAMAKLLQNLGVDPCFSQVLGQVCGPELKTAIGL